MWMLSSSRGFGMLSLGRYWALLSYLSAVSAAFLPLDQQKPLSESSHSEHAASRIPLVIWHGLGDKYDSDGMISIGALLNESVGRTYTYNVRIDDDSSADQSATFFGNLTEQIQDVCEKISEDPILSKAEAINAIGFSQGGQFMRAYVERCNRPPVKNLVTFGSQHNGISEFNNCASSSWNPSLCAVWNTLLKTQTWTKFVQNKLVPAQYFRNLEDLDNYLEYSNLLVDINNEREIKNATYKANIMNLNSFITYMFSNDTTVVPKESAYFYDVLGTGAEANITHLKDRALYKEDWLGLKALDAKGGLQFRVAEGGHMALTEELLTDVFREMYDTN